MQQEGLGRAALILALLLAAVLAVFLVRHQKQEQQRMRSLQEMMEQAEPLERELARLERELAQSEHSADQVVRSAFFSVGFQLSEPDDVDLAAQYLQQYPASPVLVLDPGAERFQELLTAAHDAALEVVLTSEPFEETALSARESLSEAEVLDSGAFLLSKSDDSAENLDRIGKAGFSGVVRYAEKTETDVATNGMVYLCYSRVKSSDYSIESRLREADQNSQALLIVFDMSALHDGSLSEERITKTLTQILDSKAYSGVKYGTVSEAMAAVKAADAAHAVPRGEADESVILLQDRIDEIRAELDEIYAQWNKENRS